MKTQHGENVIIFGGLLSLLAAVLAISPGSLWVDEFGTWFITRADTLSDWWRGFESSQDSDTQIPLYHFFMYAWTKLVGTTGIAMRASNIGMFVIATIALLWPYRGKRNIAVPLIYVSCLSAPLWYYVNEVRPYIMLYMGMCLMIGSALRAIGSRAPPSSSAMALLCAGATISCGASVIGVVWAGGVALFTVLYWSGLRRRPLRELLAANKVALVLSALAITAFIIHDFWMFTQGKYPALSHDTNIQTIIFSFYTDLGLLGVGPGMLDLRANGARALVDFFPIVAVTSIMFGLLAIAGCTEVSRALGSAGFTLLLVCTAVPIAVIFGLGFAMHWRVLPRHLIPLVALVNLLYAFGMARWWESSVGGRLLVLSAALLMSYSALSVRYAPRHLKDDYKYAAELALAELSRGGRVWWVADFRGALYYNVPSTSDPVGEDSRKARLIYAHDFAAWSTQESPTLVLVSRPDAYDRLSLVRTYLAKNKYRLVESFPAFTAWRR
jgi:hypothetical protein